MHKNKGHFHHLHVTTRQLRFVDMTSIFANAWLHYNIQHLYVLSRSINFPMYIFTTNNIDLYETPKIEFI